MVLLTWRLMPDEMHPRWNREAWESQFYFTSRTLSGNKSLFVLDTASRQLLPTGPLQLHHQIYFTSRTLSGSRILRLSNGAMVGLIANAFPSSQCVLTVKRFRTTKCAL